MYVYVAIARACMEKIIGLDLDLNLNLDAIK